MFTISNLKYIFLILLLSACQSKIKNLEIKNEHLSLVDGVMLYEEKPYTGTLVSKTDTITTYKVGYLKGEKHGKEARFYFNGKIASERFYTNGKNSGTHKAWWDNGQLEFEKQFDARGNQIGMEREWHRNGKLAKEFNFTNGKENGTQKMWDSNGKIEANYIVINGERFGLIGSTFCKPDNYVD